MTRHATTRALLVPALLAWPTLACSESPPSTGEDSDTTTTEVSTDSSSDADTTDPTESGSSETETTGDPPLFCGDGLPAFGEECDDANLDDTDGCTSRCMIGPCGFEWRRRELVLTGSDFAISTPFVLDGADLVIAHQLGDGGQQTGLVRATANEGAVFVSTELELGPGSSTPDAMARGPAGELFLARVGQGDVAEIHRLTNDGTVEWTVDRPTRRWIPDLQLSPSGELVFVNTIDNGPMDDQVELAALDPGSGGELWAHSFGGPIAPNGFSTDRGAALAIAEDGRTFVAYDEYVDWDTLAPVVVAFNPDGDPMPLWSTQVLLMAGRQPQIRGMAIGPAGNVAVIFEREDGSQIFWIASLDAETGAVDFVVERDDFGFPNELSRIRAVGVTDDRVLAAGTWEVDMDGVEVNQGFLLGLDFAGELVCLATLDDYDSFLHLTEYSYLPADMLISEAGLYLTGYVYAFNDVEADLLFAKFR